MKKKVISALLSVAMVATLLVGCGGQAAAPAAEAAPAATEEKAEEAAPAAEEAPAEEAAEEVATEDVVENNYVEYEITPDSFGYDEYEYSVEDIAKDDDFIVVSSKKKEESMEITF